MEDYQYHKIPIP